MRHWMSALLLLCVASCETRPVSVHRSAASLLSTRYAESGLAKWNMHVRTAGRRCDVLLVETNHVLDIGIVEGMHYGAGPFSVYDGGVHDFYREQTFRGVVYRDVTNRVWTYGDVTTPEAESIQPCD